MGPMMAFGGNELLNLIINKAYNSQPDRFRGAGTKNRIQYNYSVPNIPVGRLISGAATHNFEIDLMVLLKTQGSIVLTQNFALRATGKIGISNSILSITQLSVTNITIAPIDAMIANIINKEILPPLSKTLKNIPLPQLNNLFGSGLSANLASSGVIAAPALQIDSTIVGHSGIANASIPPAAKLNLLNNSNTPNQATLIALVSDQAANILFHSSLSSREFSFNKSETGWGFGAGIRVKIKMMPPVLEIRNGVGKITTTLKFILFKAGAKGPLGWTWIDIPVPNIIVKVNHQLIIDDNKAVIKITGFERIKIDLNFTGILNAVEDTLEDILNAIIKEFKDLLSDVIKGRKITIFKFPANILGTSFNANATITNLSYFNNSIQASFEVSG